MPAFLSKLKQHLTKSAPALMTEISGIASASGLQLDEVLIYQFAVEASLRAFSLVVSGSHPSASSPQMIHSVQLEHPEIEVLFLQTVCRLAVLR